MKLETQIKQCSTCLMKHALFQISGNVTQVEEGFSHQGAMNSDLLHQMVKTLFSNTVTTVILNTIVAKYRIWATLSWPPLIARCKRGVRAAGGDVRETDQTAEERAEWEWAEHLPPQVIPEFLCLRRFESWNPPAKFTLFPFTFLPLHLHHIMFLSFSWSCNTLF